MKKAPPVEPAVSGKDPSVCPEDPTSVAWQAYIDACHELALLRVIERRLQAWTEDVASLETVETAGLLAEEAPAAHRRVPSAFLQSARRQARRFAREAAEGLGRTWTRNAPAKRAAARATVFLMIEAWIAAWDTDRPATSSSAELVEVAKRCDLKLVREVLGEIRVLTSRARLRVEGAAPGARRRPGRATRRASDRVRSAAPSD